MKKTYTFRMLAIAAVFFTALTVTAEESRLSCFQPAFPEKEAVEVAPDNGEVFTEVMEFPALPAKEGMTPVLKADVRIVFKTPGGWNHFCSVEFNGKYLGEKTAAGTLRLLGRGAVMETTHPKDKAVPYWKPGKRPAMLVMFGPKDSTEADKRITSSRELAYEYYFDISDLVSSDSAASNQVRFLFRMAKNVGDFPLYVQHVTIGYIPTEMLAKLNVAKEQ